MGSDFGVLETISRKLGREVLPLEEGNVSSFSNFTDADLDEIRILGQSNTILAITYITFRVKGNVGLGNAMAYFSEVICQGKPWDEWRRSL